MGVKNVGQSPESLSSMSVSFVGCEEKKWLDFMLPKSGVWILAPITGENGDFRSHFHRRWSSSIVSRDVDLTVPRFNKVVDFRISYQLWVFCLLLIAYKSYHMG
jgi:hypothetical protein